jgi:WD40 repeat protein
MASLFISYSRKDIDTARKLCESFTGQGLDFWIDWQGIPPTTEWWKEIERGIETADNFLFLISPDSAKSKVCKQEIEHATKNGKRLIPVVVRDIQADQAPAELQPLNWIFFREHDEFNASFNKLITAIKTDYEWAQIHRELQVKALEWDRSKREASFLLRDKELSDAELQLASNSSKEPYPTDLQREYVLVSRQAADRERRNRTRITTVISIVLAVLAVFGFVQARLATANAKQAQAASTLAVHNQEIAEERANIATARYAAMQAINLRDKRLDLALLLAVEANRRLNNSETQSVLFDNLRFAPSLLQFEQKEDTSAENSPLNTLGELAGTDFPILAISSDGKIGASGSRSRIIKVWDLTSKTAIGEMTLPGADDFIPLTALAFSQDGKKLASGTDGGELEVWDVTNQQLLSGPVWVEDFVTSISFNTSGEYLAVGESTDNVVGVYDASLNAADESTLDSPDPMIEPLAWLEGGHNDYINRTAFNADDSILASGGADGRVILWNLPELGEVGFPFNADPIILLGQTDSVTDLEFSNDGKDLISTDARGTRIKWAVILRDPIEKTFRTYDLISSSSISPNGRSFAYHSGQQIVLLDIPTLRTMEILYGDYITLEVEPAFPYPDKPKTIITYDTFLAFSPNNQVLTYNSDSGKLTLWDSKTKMALSTPINPQKGIVAASFNHDGKILALGNEAGIVSLWDLASKSRIATLTGHSAKIRELQFSSTGNSLISGGADHKIIIWDLETKQPMNAALEGNGVMALSPDGKTLAYGDPNGIPILFDLINYEPIGVPLNGHKEVYALSFNADGSILASSGSDSNRETNDPSYNNIILWNVASQKQIGQTIHSSLEGGGSTAFNGISGIFSSDGKSFLVNDNLGHISLWDISLQSWLDRSCKIAGRNLTQEEWADYFPGEEYQKTCEQWPEGK